MTRRSLLFSPGDRPELLRKAPGSGADVVCFDLEDSVSPGRKAEAREAIGSLLRDPAFDPDATVSVRLTVSEPTADLDALVDPVEGGDDDDQGGPVSPRLEAVVLPKVETAKRVETVSAMCSERGLDVDVFALIETAEGVLSARDIAGAEPTDALLFGAEDLAVDLGATRTAAGREVLYARQHVVLAAAAAGVDALDAVFTDFSDTAGLRRESAFAVELGYDGKMAIHPDQVPVIHDAYTPEPDRIEWAERVIDARDAAAADDRAVFEVDGEMIDAPLVARAERVLARATAAGKR